MEELSGLMNEIINEIEEKDRFMKMLETDSSDSDSSASEKNYKTYKKQVRKTDENDNEEENNVNDEDEDEQVRDKEGKYLKTKGEITLEELTPPESFTVKLDENVQIIKMGRVLSIVDNKLFVIQSFIEENLPPFDEETILFDAARNAIGKIHETFGPVANPFYTIRKTQEATVELNSFVFFVPNSNDYTKYIFNVEEWRKLKGSDASWSNDNEPPEEYLDYSDDEKEKRAKKQLKLKKIKEKNENDSDLSTDEDFEDAVEDDEKEEQEKRKEKTQSIAGINQFKQRNKDKRVEYNKMKKAKSFVRSHQTPSNNQHQPYRQSTFKKSNSLSDMFTNKLTENNIFQRINPQTSMNNNNNNMPSNIQSNMQFNSWPNQMAFMPQYNPYFTPFYNNFLPSTPNFMTPPPNLMQQAQFQPNLNQYMPNIRPNYINNQMNQTQVMDRRFVQNQQFIKKSF